MSDQKKLEEYSPKWCPHVKGVFTREIEDGKPVPTWVTMTCEVCGDVYRKKCESGAPTQWILKFAQQHVHRDPLRDPFPAQKPR